MEAERWRGGGENMDAVSSSPFPFTTPGLSSRTTVLLHGLHTWEMMLRLEFRESIWGTICHGEMGEEAEVDVNGGTGNSEKADVMPSFRHSFHPSPAATDDTIIYLWAHPRDTDEPMDRLFFETLLRYLSDLYESGRNPNLLQIMVTQ